MSNESIPISGVGAKLTIASKLRTRPLRIYGSKTIPSGAVPSTSISWRIAQEMTLGLGCGSFVSYGAGRVENTQADAVFAGPVDLTGNSWFPQNYLSLAMPIETASRMANDLEYPFLTKRPYVSNPEQRAGLLV